MSRDDGAVMSKNTFKVGDKVRTNVGLPLKAEFALREVFTVEYSDTANVKLADVDGLWHYADFELVTVEPTTDTLQGWQPIETMPRGKYVLVAFASGELAVYAHYDLCNSDRATHWQPLPEPPPKPEKVYTLSLTESELDIIRESLTAVLGDYCMRRKCELLVDKLKVFQEKP